MGSLYVSISSYGANPSKPAPAVLQQSRELIEDMGAELVKNLPAMRETWVGNIPWRREQLPTPVFWLGEFHRLYSPWGLRESDTTK